MNGRTNSNNNTTGFEIEVPLDPVIDVAASPGNGQVELTWTDPLDKYAATEGEVAESPNPIVSQWDHTRVVRKENTQPTGPNDGVIIVSSDVRNQYQSTPYVDSGLINDTLYHYGLFACNTAGLFSTGAFGSATPKAGTPLSQLPEGTVIKILENGSPVEFYLAKHNYEPGLNGEGRELVVRKNIYDQRQWNSSRVNTWVSSTMRSWLNGAYKSLFSSRVQSLMGATTYRYTPGDRDNDVTTRADAVFLMSVTELGLSNDSGNVEGSSSPIASVLRIAHQSGSATQQFTRSPHIDDDVNICCVGFNGGLFAAACTDTHGSRPTFTLPNTIIIDWEMNIVV